MISAGYLALLGQWNVGSYDELGMWLGQERQGMHTEFWWGKLLENGHLKIKKDMGGY